MAESVEQLLRKLEAQIDAAGAEAINCAYELRFVGEEQRWYLDLRQSQDYLSTRPPDDGEFCSLGLPVADLSDLVEGRVSLKVLFSSGSLRVFGDIAQAMKLESLFSRS